MRWRVPPHQVSRIACAHSVTAGFLALVRHGATLTLVGARRRRGQLRITTNPHALAMIATVAEGPARDVSPTRVLQARRHLARWCAARAAREVLGNPSGDASAMRAARRRLDAILQRTPLASRGTLAEECTTALDALARSPGVGTGQALRRLLRTGDPGVARDARDARDTGKTSEARHPLDADEAFTTGLKARADLLHHGSRIPPSMKLERPKRERPKLVALLLLEPCA